VARRRLDVGARDTARDGHARRLSAALSDALAGLRQDAARGGLAPRCVAAAGMITSPQGLHEVAHVLAPIGVVDLAAAAREVVIPEVCDLPFVLVPGVRTPPTSATAGGDVMRGEETLSLGLLEDGRLAAGGALLNVGSHWKLVGVDDEGRIARSVTSLAGEMMDAARTQTILASAVPGDPIADVDATQLFAGMDEARRSGLARALFCVRLLELSGTTEGNGRLSFLAGAFIGADLDGLRSTGVLAPGTPVLISGDDKLGGAWSAALEREGHPARALSADEVEAAFLAGLAAVMRARAR
jgi:2-dehydro-3-deoxygalactonokinase